MKYLKPFNEGLDSNLHQTIDDISLDLNDEGCIVRYDFKRDGSFGTIEIISSDDNYIDPEGYRDMGRFTAQNIIPYVKRIYDYMESEGYHCTLICPMIFDKIESKDISYARYKDITFEELEEYKDVEVMSISIMCKMSNDDWMRDMKYLKPFNESNENDLTLTIHDILTDATDEGIKLRVLTSGPLNTNGHRSYIEVILHKIDRYVEPFTLKDIKTGIDTLINTLKDDEYELTKVDMVDGDSSSRIYDIKKIRDPWEYFQNVIEDNSFQRTYPDRDFPLKLVKLTFKCSNNVYSIN